MLRNGSKAAALIAVVAGVVYAGWPGSIPAGAAPKSSDTRRAFYMTRAEYVGSEAANACASGFHMASIFEILDVSTLRYDTSRGFVRADSGSGPPAYLLGWVRTGYFASGAPDVGSANCEGWTADASAHGTAVHLRWPVDPGTGLTAAWDDALSPCSNSLLVWCVQD